jgi:hypothetical protein
MSHFVQWSNKQKKTHLKYLNLNFSLNVHKNFEPIFYNVIGYKMFFSTLRTLVKFKEQGFLKFSKVEINNLIPKIVISHIILPNATYVIGPSVNRILTI